MATSSTIIHVELVGTENAAARSARSKLDPGAEYISGGFLAASREVESIDTAAVQSGIAAICSAVGAGLQNAGPDSWAVEINLGFKAGLKLPVLMSGEANAALKVTMNWTKTA